MLAYRLNLNIEDIDRAVLYAVLLHDVGKLTINWQAFAKEWQRRKDPGVVLLEPLAHTDFDPAKDQKIQRTFRRPLMPWKVRMPSMSTCKVLAAIRSGGLYLHLPLPATIPGMGLNWDAST